MANQALVFENLWLETVHAQLMRQFAEHDGSMNCRCPIAKRCQETYELFSDQDRRFKAQIERNYREPFQRMVPR